MSAPNRYSGATVDTIEDLRKRVADVLATPDIAGFDCMLDRKMIAGPPATHFRRELFVKGVTIQVQGDPELSTETHYAARLVITRPLKLEDI